MPRSIRNSTIAGFYHVMLQGNEKKDIFDSSSEKSFIINLLLKNAERNNITIVAYCVMSNHVHIVLHCNQVEDMSKLISQTATAYGERYNEKNDRVGHVFRDRYKSKYIGNQIYLFKCIKYVHNNPVKAGIVDRCTNYHFSSYIDYYCKAGIFTSDLCKLCGINKLAYNEIMDMSAVGFCDIEDEIDVGEVIAEIKKRYISDAVFDADFKNVVNELKTKYGIPYSKIAEYFGISIDKTRRTAGVMK